MVATPPPAQADYATQHAADLVALKSEITSLRNLITSAVEEIKNAIMSICTKRNSMPTSTATDDNCPMEMQPSQQPILELQDVIHDLKQEIATIVFKMRALFHQQATKMMLAHPAASVT